MTLIATLQTSPARAGAIGVVQVIADSPRELDGWLIKHALGVCRVGSLTLRDLLGADTGVVARWNERSVHLMPHGGVAVMRRLTHALQRAEVLVAGSASPTDAFPEARDESEARVLAALARAASPLAIDLLLDQAGRRASGLEPDPEHSRVLDRLIDPPLVVATGPTNVGKSTLLNTLAGRRVSVVADQPGTTRDHVGVLIDLAGLVIRFVDTPGQRSRRSDDELEAAEVAGEVVARADLVLCCADAACAQPRRHARASLVVATRVDLGKPAWTHDAAVSAPAGAGVEELVRLIRDTLVPPAVLADPRPWSPSWPGDGLGT